jgi:type II secretory pathway predicted ATPase ExeA/cell division septation protein DedD
MYRHQFGFKKNPFRQSTDLERLFLGRHHEEALAHLTYAVIEGEGFSVITGESGVGKTTVCRSFVERLDRQVVAAFITAAPGLSPLQLLKTITTELGVHSGIRTIKDLTDALNAFLIQKKHEDKKVALFIDDAHLLSNEALEQVRLLSNLETTRDKLLQIVLIGRPALSDILGSPSLRQIGQRVSVNYFISPLDYEETVAYVQHRISISSTGPPVRFDQAAIRTVHKFTDGIPRRINTACDRILTEAYKRRERSISAKTAIDVLRQRPKGSQDMLPPGFFRRNPLLLVGSGILLLAVIAGWVYISSEPKTGKPSPAPGTQADKLAEQKRAQPPAAPAGTGLVPAAPSVQAESDGAAEKKDAAPVDKDQLLAVLDSMRLQHNLDRIETTAAVGSEPSTELSYSVQVGAFLMEANAQRRADQLTSKGYTPQITAVTDPQERIWYTVRIGDFPSIELAQKLADEFSAREKKASVVRPFNAY